MSRGTWGIEKKVNGVWTADGTIYRPNSDFLERKISLQGKMRLLDGEDAYITPVTKFSPEPLVFVYLEVEFAFKAKLEGYIDNQNDLRITDHNSVEYVGRFINTDVTWIVGRAVDTYDIRAVFERMDNLE